MKIGIILRPVLTEKASGMVAANVYTFQVGVRVNKHQIKQAVESMYKVIVSEVRIVKKVGKTRRSGKRMQTRKMPDRKFAYISLKQGSIDLFPKS